MAQEQIKRTALVVEDEPAISRACQRVLMAAGFEVDIALNGLIAMKMVDEKSYDICLSDIKIPVMGGIEFYYHLKKEHPDLAARTIFTSGDIMSSNTAEFLKKVNRPFLAKPFTPDTLMEAVHKVIA
jgi:two-component system sensor histidine kinase/response regulator